MKKIPILIFAIIAIFSFMQYSCDFEPSGVNFVDVDSNPKAAYFKMTVLNSSDSVIYSEFANKLRISFTVRSNVKIIKCDFYLEGEKVAILNNDIKKNDTLFTNYFEVFVSDTTLFKEFKMSCDIHLKPYTESFSDLHDKESNIKKYNWTIVRIKKNLIKTAEIINGELNGLDIKINIKPYYPNDFQAYYLLKNDVDTVAVSNDKLSTFLLDSTYIGEIAKYNLLIKTTSNFIKSADYYWTKSETPPYTISYLGNNSYKFVITENKFFNRIKGCKLAKVITPKNEIIGGIDFPSSSFEIQNVPINGDYLLTFYPKAKLLNTSINKSIKVLANPFPEFVELYPSKQNKIYLKSYNSNQHDFYLDEYNFGTNKLVVLDLIFGYYFFDNSPNDDYFIYITDGDYIKILNTNNNQLVYSEYLRGFDISLSVNDVGDFAYYSPGFLKVINYKTGITKCEKHYYIDSKLLDLSSDGSILVSPSTLVNLKTCDSVQMKPKYGEIICIDPTNDKRILMYSGDNVISHDIESHNTVKIYPIKNGQLKNIDRVSKTIFYYDVDDKNIKWIDYENGNLINKMYFPQDNIMSRFYNNKLFIANKNTKEYFFLPFE